MSVFIKRNTITKELTMEQLNHIRFLLCPYDTLSYELDSIPEYLEKSYKCLMPFAYRGSDGNFHGYCGHILTDGSDDGLDDLFELTDVDIYCSPQGYKKSSRSVENLQSIQNLIIDLDYHDGNMSIAKLNAYLRKIVPDLLAHLPIKPNFVNYTGRGLQLWWCIEPCHVSLINYAKNCLSALKLMVGNALCAAGDVLLSVDSGASKRLTGLFRLPYCYNTVAKRWSTGKLIHKKRPNVVKLHKSLCKVGFACYENLPDWVKEKYKAKSYKTPNTSLYKIKKGDFTPCFIYRKKALDHIISVHGISEGNRNNMLFAYYSVCYNLYDDSFVAQNIVNDLNDSLIDPLPINEMDVLFKSYDKKHYRYSDKKFFELLGYDKPVLPHVPTKKERAKKQVQEKRDKRDDEILRLHALGTPIAQIARTLGLSRTTVYKVISYVPFD